jgi:hypothetical protein
LALHYRVRPALLHCHSPPGTLRCEGALYQSQLVHRVVHRAAQQAFGARGAKDARAVIVGGRQQPQGAMRGLRRAPLLLAMLACQALAVHHLYDETQYMKADWASHKIDYPLRNYNPTDDDSSISEDIKELLKHSRLNSLDGPMARRSGSPFLGYSKEHSMMDVVDDTDMADHAAEAVKCTVCHTIIAYLWSHAVVAVNRGRGYGRSDVEALLEGACAVSVTDEVLSRQAVYKLEAQAGGASVVFFVVRDRRTGSERTLSEEIAVNKACQVGHVGRCVRACVLGWGWTYEPGWQVCRPGADARAAELHCSAAERRRLHGPSGGGPRDGWVGGGAPALALGRRHAWRRPARAGPDARAAQGAGGVRARGCCRVQRPAGGAASHHARGGRRRVRGRRRGGGAGEEEARRRRWGAAAAG